MTTEKMISSVRLKKLVTKQSRRLTLEQALKVLHLMMLMWKML